MFLTLWECQFSLQSHASAMHVLAAAEHRLGWQAALEVGMGMQSQAEVGSALQVFHNLHELQPVRLNPITDGPQSATAPVAGLNIRLHQI